MFKNDLFIGKLVVITGGSGGIGEVIVNSFSKLGAKVCILDIQQPSYALPKGSEFISCDFNQEESVLGIISIITTRFGEISYLINNARSASKTLPLNENIECFKETCNVGVMVPLLLSQSFIKSGNLHNSLRAIVNISSIASKNVSTESASYHIAKAGIDSLTRYLAVWGGEFGVRVNSVAPGFIVQSRHIEKYLSDENKEYRSLAEKGHPLKKVGTSEDIANIVVFLCSELASFINGQTIIADGGLCLRDGWCQLNC